MDSSRPPPHPRALPPQPILETVPTSPQSEGSTTRPGSATQETTTKDSASSSPYSSASVTPLLINTYVPRDPMSKHSRKAPSTRTLGRTSNDHLNSDLAASLKRVPSSASTVIQPSAPSAVPKDTRSVSRSHLAGGSSVYSARGPQRVVRNPRLPHDESAPIAPSTVPYWSRPPIWGTPPGRGMKGHTVTLVDTTVWLFGGSDDSDKDKSKELYCFDTETMQWSHPETHGDVPPPIRGHTATLFDRKQIIVYGGGDGTVYYDHVYVFDTTTHRWTRPQIAPGPRPAPRRAHSAVMYNNKLWIFGGGTGLTALNDVWALDLSVGLGRPLRWECVRTTGACPTPRGYHTANLVKDVMVVIGGSDAKDAHWDIWILELDKLIWHTVGNPQEEDKYRRLAHSSTQIGSYLLVFGGYNNQGYSTDVLLYNLVTLQYEPRKVLGTPPSARGYHAAVLADSRIFIFGGFNDVRYFDDVHTLDLAGSSYLPQVMSFEVMEGARGDGSQSDVSDD